MGEQTGLFIKKREWVRLFCFLFFFFFFLFGGWVAMIINQRNELSRETNLGVWNYDLRKPLFSLAKVDQLNPTTILSSSSQQINQEKYYKKKKQKQLSLSLSLTRILLQFTWEWGNTSRAWFVSSWPPVNVPRLTVTTYIFFTFKIAFFFSVYIQFYFSCLTLNYIFNYWPTFALFISLLWLVPVGASDSFDFSIFFSY